MTVETDKTVVRWESHIQTISLAVISAGLVAFGSLLWTNNARMAEMGTKLDALKENVAMLQGTIAAMQANYVSRAEFNGHEQRLQSLESKGQR